MYGTYVSLCFMLILPLELVEKEKHFLENHSFLFFPISLCLFLSLTWDAFFYFFFCFTHIFVFFCSIYLIWALKTKWKHYCFFLCCCFTMIMLLYLNVVVFLLFLLFFTTGLFVMFVVLKSNCKLFVAIVGWCWCLHYCGYCCCCSCY